MTHFEQDSCICTSRYIPLRAGVNPRNFPDVRQGPRSKVAPSVTLKSGTNQYHGNVFEFLRNFDTDATPLFQQAGDGKPIYQ
jgi:hypothetical protein